VQAAFFRLIRFSPSLGGICIVLQKSKISYSGLVSTFIEKKEIPPEKPFPPLGERNVLNFGWMDGGSGGVIKESDSRRQFIFLTLTPAATWQRGCQMVDFQTKNPNLGNFWRALQRKMCAYFWDIWYILQPSVLLHGHLWSFGIFFRVLVCCTKTNLATLRGNRDKKWSGLSSDQILFASFKTNFR
jgi:hypothetical protein